MSDLTVILPTRNEVKALNKVIEEIRGSVPCEILVVDTNSTDGTRECALSKGCKLVDEPSRGKGVAVRTGIGKVSTPYLVIMNADFTYPAFYLAAVYQVLKTSGADAVFGCRFLKDKEAGVWLQACL